MIVKKKSKNQCREYEDNEIEVPSPIVSSDDEEVIQWKQSQLRKRERARKGKKKELYDYLPKQYRPRERDFKLTANPSQANRRRWKSSMLSEVVAASDRDDDRVR